MLLICEMCSCFRSQGTLLVIPDQADAEARSGPPLALEEEKAPMCSVSSLNADNSNHLKYNWSRHCLH